MAKFEFDRRAIMLGGGTWMAAAAAKLAIGGNMIAGPAHAQQTKTPFGRDTVREMAERLAAKDYVPPKASGKGPEISYDQYRKMIFRPERSIWRGDHRNFELQLFPMGWLFDTPVDIFVVDGGEARMVSPDISNFKFEAGANVARGTALQDYSGLRVHGAIDGVDFRDEFVVFQGASYFRSVARGQVYGLSARGLALNTARNGGEEFPLFRALWVEKPKPDDTRIIVHALLDSPSVAGAYRFDIAYGQVTTMDVEMTLFPRRALGNVGIAPISSMFLFDGQNRRAPPDFRPAVHDSEALAVLNGNGERLWRPLANPLRLQISEFQDNSPKGFGLIQRDRRLSTFEDLEALYHRRPSLWIEPKEDWGPGHVELIEIPIKEEIHDNIVAFWSPREPLADGAPHDFSYRLNWTTDVNQRWAGARVFKTRFGQSSQDEDATVFIVDFTGPAVTDYTDLPVAEVSTDAGNVTGPVIQPYGEINGVRVGFRLMPGGARTAELRLSLSRNGRTISEVWLYRWHRD